MTEKKIVVIAERVKTSSQGEFDKERRTAVFNEDSTISEVLDWARERNEDFSLGYWENAKITIIEDDLNKPKKPLGGFFTDLEKEEVS